MIVDTTVTHDDVTIERGSATGRELSWILASVMHPTLLLPSTSRLPQAYVAEPF